MGQTFLQWWSHTSELRSSLWYLYSFVLSSGRQIVFTSGVSNTEITKNYDFEFIMFDTIAKSINLIYDKLDYLTFLPLNLLFIFIKAMSFLNPFSSYFSCLSHFSASLTWNSSVWVLFVAPILSLNLKWQDHLRRNIWLKNYYLLDIV